MCGRTSKQHQEKRRPWGFRSCLLVVIGLVVALAVLWILLGIEDRRYIRTVDPERAQRPLTEFIRPASEMYADSHGGQFPDHLEDIWLDEGTVRELHMTTFKGRIIPRSFSEGRRLVIVPGLRRTREPTEAHVLVYELGVPGRRDPEDDYERQVLMTDLTIKWMRNAEALTLVEEVNKKRHTYFDVEELEEFLASTVVPAVREVVQARPGERWRSDVFDGFDEELAAFRLGRRGERQEGPTLAEETGELKIWPRLVVVPMTSISDREEAPHLMVYPLFQPGEIPEGGEALVPVVMSDLSIARMNYWEAYEAAEEIQREYFNQRAR